jgi:diketogulonate reductase-like aldo/keto reductase
VEYADLYLIHFPQLVAHDFENTWKEFEKIKDDGLAK